MSASFTAFADERLLATGALVDVARSAAEASRAGDALLIIFDDETGLPVDLDLRRGPEGAVREYETRMAPAREPERRGRGRPKLGVVAREVTLLPRHWDWLAGQPGGASAALRRLVEEARKTSGGVDRARAARDALYGVMSALAGNLPHFEDAARALYAHDRAGIERIVATWPPDIASYILRLADNAGA